MDQVGDRLPFVCPRRFGCCPDAARYSISADNVRTLRTFKGQTVNIGAFTAAKPGQTEITWRGVGPIKTPDGAPVCLNRTPGFHRLPSGIEVTWNIARPVMCPTDGPSRSPRTAATRRATSVRPRRTFRRSVAEGVAAALQLR